MSYKTLTVQRKGNVIIISMMEQNDIEKGVRLSNELTDLCEEITLDENIRVIVVTGTGKKSFSIETDSIKIISRGDVEPWARCRFIAEPIAKLDRPVIAAIHGDAVGQGLELTLACDLRIAQETSRFGLPHIQTGLIPWDGGSQRLARLVGRGRALEMILTGETIDAQEAYRIGLVNKVVSPDRLMDVAMNMAHEMATKGPIALRYAKETIYKGMDMILEQGLRLEADLYCLLHSTRDRTEGIEAFRGKRAPKFEGK
jgi:enoyl-CoA hydratase